jgi:6-phosphogluconolactonase (cycloisomerase 2 family)
MKPSLKPSHMVLLGGFALLLGCGGGSGSGSGSTSPGGGASGKSVAFVASQSTGQLQAYTIDPTSGTLTAVGTPQSTQNSPYGVAVTPSGTLVYVSNTASNSVSGYSWNGTTNTLTLLGSIGTGTSTSPEGLVVDATGHFLYVADYNVNGISAFVINSDGSLTPIDANAATPAVVDPFPAGLNPNAMAADPGGDFIYATNLTDKTLQMYAINHSTGALTSLGSITTVGAPGGVAAQSTGATGQYVYVSDQTNGVVRGYVLDRTHGTLTANGFLASGTGPAGLAAHPTKFQLFTPNMTGNSATAYAITPSTGVLTYPSGSLVTANTGSTPMTAAVDGIDGFLVVTCSNSTAASVFKINSDGSLTHQSDPAVLTGCQGIAIVPHS